MTYVTPYLPDAAQRIAAEWKRSGKVAFVRAYQQVLDACPNCQGAGFLVLVLADKGPLRAAALGKTVSTWYDGDGQQGKGWYTVSDTRVITCPECKGLDRAGDKPKVLPPQDLISRLDDLLGRKEQLHD
jgi:hypothetical protein